MSALIMGQVFGLLLPHPKKLVLLAMADHADHEGRNVYPSIGLLAWKTGYSKNQVRRIVQSLESDRILVKEKVVKGGTTTYRIFVESGVKNPPFIDTPTPPTMGVPPSHSCGSPHPSHHGSATPPTMGVPPPIAVVAPPPIAMGVEPSVNNKDNTVPESLSLSGDVPKKSQKKKSDPIQQERFDRFSESWSEAFEMSNQNGYVWTKADAIQARHLLNSTDDSPEKLVQTAINAWRLPNGFLRQQALSVRGFASKINEIRAELSNPHKPNGSRVSDRIALEQQRRIAESALRELNNKKTLGIFDQQESKNCNLEIAKYKELLQSIDAKLTGTA